MDALEEHNRYVDGVELEDFKGGRMNDSRECILEFGAEVIPVYAVP